MGSSQAGLAPAFDAFRKGLHERGWIENQNIAIEYRWAGDSTDRLPELAAELARLKVDIIIGSTPGVGAAQQATPRIPIIMYIADDAVKQGSVANLARPSGNITGMAERCLDDIAKRQALFGCEGRTFGVHPLRTWRERTSRRLICDFHNPRRSSPPGRGAEAFGKAQRPSLRRERPRCGRAQTGLSKERRTIVFTMKWHPMRMITLMLAFLGVMAQSANADAVRDGPKVGQWKTWVLASGKEIQVPAPPPETSDQTKAELAELRQLQKERSPSANTAIQYYNAVPATQRWHDLAHTIARAEKQSLNRQAWMASILHTALHDAVIVTWAAKYQFNRKPPSQMASDLTVVVPITGEVSAPEPSYPSEHAAIAGTAIGILTAYFPKEAANLKAAAAELGQTRLLMGANYRSDIDALQRVLVNTPSGAQIPLGQIAGISLKTGPGMIRDENGRLSGYVYVDVSGRDIGGYVTDAKKVVTEKVSVPAGYQLVWSGQYEAMERVKERLKIVLPITLFIVFLLLYFNTKSTVKTFIILLAVPFSAIGAIWFLYLLNYNMSIAVWVGLIALLGVDAETAVFMLLYLDLAYHEAISKGRMNTWDDLREAIVVGAVKRLRPKVMTVACMLFGLLPIMWSVGSGGDVMKRIAAPMIGGIITSFLMELIIYPPVFAIWKWNLEVKPRLKQQGPKPLEPNLQEPVHA